MSEQAHLTSAWNVFASMIQPDSRKRRLESFEAGWRAHQRYLESLGEGFISEFPQIIKSDGGGWIGYCGCQWRTWKFNRVYDVAEALKTHTKENHKNGALRPREALELARNIQAGVDEVIKR